jgi:phosphate transport system permease protein
MMRMKDMMEKALTYTTMAAALFTSMLLVLIIGSIAIRALPAISLNFLLVPEIGSPGMGGSIANAIAGTICLSVLSVLIALPFSLGTALYLKRYARENAFTRILGFLIDVLSGTPSIVLGVFAFFFIVYYMKAITGGVSLLSGSIALAILVMPVIERAAEGAIDTVPSMLEEGSYALGASRWQTISRITVPYALSGIVTGVVLSFGRAAEESAIVILTAGYTLYMPSFGAVPNPVLAGGIQINPLQDVIATLPVSIYHAYEYSYMIPRANGFAAALVLIAIVMAINALARLVLWKWSVSQ